MIIFTRIGILKKRKEELKKESVMDSNMPACDSDDMNKILTLYRWSLKEYEKLNKYVDNIYKVELGCHSNKKEIPAAMFKRE